MVEMTRFLFFLIDRHDFCCNIKLYSQFEKRTLMDKINVMVAGLPGRMATLVADAVEKQVDMYLHQFALSDQSGNEGYRMFVPPDEHDRFLRLNRVNIGLVVDSTTPEVVNRNADMYCLYGVPFVMNTVGGNRVRLTRSVELSNIPAVIDIRIVFPDDFLAAIRFLATQIAIPGGRVYTMVDVLRGKA